MTTLAQSTDACAASEERRGHSRVVVALPAFVHVGGAWKSGSLSRTQARNLALPRLPRQKSLGHGFLPRGGTPPPCFARSPPHSGEELLTLDPVASNEPGQDAEADQQAASDDAPEGP